MRLGSARPSPAPDGRAMLARVVAQEPVPKNVSLRLVLLILAGASCVVVPLGLGSMLPREHDGMQRVVLRADRASVYAKLADLAHWNRWNPQMGPEHDAGPNRFETRPGGNTHLDYVLVEAVPDTRVVVDLEATPPRFGARWTFELRDYQGGTRVTIREHGWLESPTARFVMGYVTGYDVAVAGVCRALINSDVPARTAQGEGTSPP